MGKKQTKTIQQKLHLENDTKALSSNDPEKNRVFPDVYVVNIALSTGEPQVILSWLACDMIVLHMLAICN